MYLVLLFFFVFVCALSKTLVLFVELFCTLLRFWGLKMFEVEVKYG